MKKIAMLFPGQGSQSVGMLQDLYDKYPVVSEIFMNARDVLGYDLWKLIQTGPKEELDKTDKTQPALLSASYAIFRVWQQLYPTLQPSFMAGNSLGEYSALVCAEAIAFNDAIQLVELRGRLMQNAVAEGVGSMCAIIGLTNQEVFAACEQAQQDQVVTPSNFNSPEQVVIAGNKEAVTRAADICTQMGAKKVMPLAVSVPSHCPLMQPAADKLAIELDKLRIQQPKFAIINNAEVKVATDNAAIKQALVKQLYSPVRWVETIEFLVEQQMTAVYEIGPNKVLTGLNKRIVKELPAYAINSIDTLESVNLL